MKKLMFCLLALAAMAITAQAQTTGVLREVWNNLDGSTVASLTSSPNFPANPVLRVVDSSFQSPVNWSDRYGVRMRAFLTPTATASYTFWIAGDDNCELWLSTDDTPANRVRIATVSNWTNALAWNTYTEQKSSLVSLQSGKRYYVEALMKEGSGGDSVAVAWATSPTDTPQVIGSANLTPYEVPAAITSNVVVEAGKALTVYSPNLTVNLSAQALDRTRPGQFPGVTWSQVSGPTASVGTPQLANTRIDLSAVGSYVFRVTATSGGVSVTDDVTVTAVPPLAPDAGSALSEYWFGVSGSTIASMSGSLDYPNYPHAHRVVNSLTSVTSLGDQYGERTRGFLLVPTTGAYRFFSAADETMEFYLSTDATTANLQLRAAVIKATNPTDFFGTAGQSSGSIQLTAGQRYAFEIRHKEEWGNDHCSVLWQQPGTDYLTDITGEFLAPPADMATASVATQSLDLVSDYLLNAGRDQLIYLPQNTASFSAYESRRYWASDTPVRTWSQVSGPAGVKFSSPAASACTATFPAIGVYVLRYSVKTLRNTSSDDVRIEVRAPLAATTGMLTRQIWWNRSYATIADLRADPAFPDHPDIVDNIVELRQSNDWASLYGTRVTGILNIPAGGTTPVNYTFYVSGDDAAEFSISTDATPANLKKVCFATKPSGRENWYNEATQVSAPVALKPGGRYFVELLHKETWGSDNFAVAWSREGDRQPSVINGSYFEPDQKVPAFDSSMNYYANAGRNRTYYWPHERTNLIGSIIKVHDTTNTPTASWRQLSGPKAAIANPADLGTEVVFPGVGAYAFELTVTEGTYTHRDSITITVAPQITGTNGYITRSVWFDVNGYSVADLYSYDAALAFPHFEDLLPGVEPPSNWADFYGTRLKGFVTVPVTGSYTFWVAADEAAELKLDIQDGNGLKKIAYNNNAVYYPHDWDRYATQKAATVTLTAGTHYAIEAVHKEGGYNDSLSIAMEGPATNGREVLSRGFLSPFKSAPVFNPDIMVALGTNRTILWPSNQVTLAALVYDLVSGPKPLTYQWSSTSTKVSFDNATSAVSVVRFTAPGVYEIKMTASDGAHTAANTVLVTVQNPLSQTAGGLLREAWLNVPGYTLNDLRNSAAYAGAPTLTDILSSFEAPTNWADNYGQRLTGFIQVPTEADYVFLIASDDESELWMNTSGEAAAGATKIAYTPYATGRYSWSRNATQQSASIHLVPGKRYYVQALHKEGGGDDYLAVAYRLASQPNSAAVVIPGVLLSPPTGSTASAFDGQINVKAGADQTAVWPHNHFTLQGLAIDYVPGPQSLAYRWSAIGGPTGMASKVVFNSPTALSTTVDFPAAGAYTLQLTATDGAVSRSDTLTITMSPALAAGTGTILCETFKNITGSWVTDLVNSPKFPNSPDDRVRLTSVELPRNQGDNYGALIRGYLYAPVTGVYRFNLASDDWGEVYLSTDKKPENKALACFVPAGTDYYEWRRFPDYQLSRPITLVAGQCYYLEIRYKQSGWRDHLELAWLKPSATSFEVIDGAYLSPWILPDAQPPAITLTGGSDVALTVGSTFVDPGFAATDLVDGNLATKVTTSGRVDTSSPGTYLINYTVKDSSGNQTTVTRKVTVVVAENQAPVYPADASGTHPTTPWSPPATLSDQEAARFLKQATFGPTDADITRVKAIGIPAWIDEQLALPVTSHLAMLDKVAQFQGAKNNLISIANTAASPGLPGSMMSMTSSPQTEDRLYTWWTHAVTAPDQLRQRIAFALSEILVISDKSGALRNYPRGCTNYYDILARHIAPGGNYRDLLEEVTFNPMMGTWLTMIRSSKVQPDENYPREIMQLFSIGLEHLNKDGTFKRDGSGNAIPSYGQAEILELSRAFTGWTYNRSPAFTWTNSTDDINPMMAFEDYHDRGRKVILGGATIPAGQTAQQDVRRALDVIAGHPNVGPFLAKRLIQRLVKSNPSPAYIFRVSSKFEDNGKGVRGDLCALVKAVLLDPEARAADTSPGAGKLSEPILRLTRLLRAFQSLAGSNPPVLGRYVLSNGSDSFGQWPMQSPTVFNFFHTDYQPPGGLLDAGLYAPEFEITTELSTVDTSNYFYDGTANGFSTNSGPRDGLDYSSLIAAAGNADALISRIETLVLARPMSADLRTNLLKALSLYPTSPSDGVKAVMQMLSSCPEFSVDR